MAELGYLGYASCAGIEASLALATVPRAKSEVSVEMAFDCEALVSGVVEISLDYRNNLGNPTGEGRVIASQGFGGGSSKFQWKTIVDAGAYPVINLKLAPTTLLEPYKAGCKIELLENAAKASEG